MASAAQTQAPERPQQVEGMEGVVAEVVEDILVDGLGLMDG